MTKAQHCALVISTLNLCQIGLSMMCVGVTIYCGNIHQRWMFPHWSLQAVSGKRWSPNCLQEHITHVERRNKELLFEQDLLKRELDNARLHNYNVQQHPSAPSAYQGIVSFLMAFSVGSWWWYNLGHCWQIHLHLQAWLPWIQGIWTAACREHRLYLACLSTQVLLLCWVWHPKTWDPCLISWRCASTKVSGAHCQSHLGRQLVSEQHSVKCELRVKFFFRAWTTKACPYNPTDIYSSAATIFIGPPCLVSGSLCSMEVMTRQCRRARQSCWEVHQTSLTWICPWQRPSQTWERALRSWDSSHH